MLGDLAWRKIRARSRPGLRRKTGLLRKWAETWAAADANGATFYDEVKPLIGLMAGYRAAICSVNAGEAAFCGPKSANWLFKCRRISSTVRSMKLLVRGGSIRRVG